MKYTLILICIAQILCAALQSQAQLTVHGDALFIQGGATLHISGLSLTPKLALAVVENSIKHLDKPIAGKPNESINRVYSFSKPIVCTGKVRFSYLPSELNGNNEELLQIAFGSKALLFKLNDNKSILHKNDHFLEEHVTDQELGVVTAANSGSVLPVKLVDFNAAINEKIIALAWTTSDEVNSDHFEIQHSINGKQWNLIGTVPASGQANALTHYNYQHFAPARGENLYRLKMVDQDNSAAYSHLRSVMFTLEKSLVFYPNPTIDWLTLTSSRQKIVELKILDLSGTGMSIRNLKQVPAAHLQTIDLRRIIPGSYILYVVYDDGTAESAKIVKQ